MHVQGQPPTVTTPGDTHANLIRLIRKLTGLSSGEKGDDNNPDGDDHPAIWVKPVKLPGPEGPTGQYYCVRVIPKFPAQSNPNFMTYFEA